VYGAKIKEGIFTVKHAVIYTVLAILGVALAFGVVTPCLPSCSSAAS